MTGRECTECGHEVGTRHGSCGHCGAPRLRRSLKSRVFGGPGAFITWSAAAVLGLIYMASLAGM
ncbi:MAG: hypothetical protein JWQ23_4101 [Herminiimonas sp.]|nr:hypothetical protein [Herminiimonas sp.]